MAQQSQFLNVGPCRWLAMGKCPSQLSILSECLSRNKLNHVNRL